MDIQEKLIVSGSAKDKYEEMTAEEKKAHLKPKVDLII
jgi:hypothetical protein